MTRHSPYFMHDQVRHRVAHIMREHHRRSLLDWSIWPLIVLVAALTLINVLTAIPTP